MTRATTRFIKRSAASVVPLVAACTLIALAQPSGAARPGTGSTPHAEGARLTPVFRGYWLAGSDGGVFALGYAPFHGSAANLPLQSPVDGIASTPDHGGYWLVAGDGGVFSFGDARYFGSIPGLGIAPLESPDPHRLIGEIVGIAPTSDGGGYYLVGADGGVFAFGDARFEGSCYGVGGCSSGIQSLVTDATGNGYWLVTDRGAVYAFGDAADYGGLTPQQFDGATAVFGQAISAVRTPSGNGYWILLTNGEIYTFGDANYYGSAFTTVDFSNPASAMFATPDGAGYWVTAFNGAVYACGDAPSYGGVSNIHLDGSIVAGAGA